MPNDPVEKLIDCIDKPPVPLEVRASAIADELREISTKLAGDHASRMFCRTLAEMIDPQGKNCTKYRLELRLKDRGRPKGPNWQLAFEMERLSNEYEAAGASNPAELAVADIQKKFGKKGHAKRTCEAALKEARNLTRAVNFFDEHVAQK